MVRGGARCGLAPGSGVTRGGSSAGAEAVVDQRPFEQMFPALTPAQIARASAHGSTRQVGPGAVLVEAGDRLVAFFIVTRGRMEVIRLSSSGPMLNWPLGPGHFTGEANLLSGRRSLVRIRATEPTELIELTRATLLALVQTDAELGEIFMRTFLPRRVYMVARGLGDVVLVGSAHSPGTLRIKEFLTRNGHPYDTVIIATGAEYRRPSLKSLSQFEGAGVYYGATFVEAQLCTGKDIIVVGGGNSAGQAAVFLAQTARRVHMFVRSDGLSGSMSRYLIRRIEDNPAVALHTYTEIVELEGAGRLERVRWRTQATGTVETSDIEHVFVMTGAVPNTRWLSGCVALDDRQFVKTGPALSQDDLAAARWTLMRPPHVLETSLPGVFAVGDVRSGNIKRVASAVGEGSIAVAFVHQVLQQ